MPNCVVFTNTCRVIDDAMKNQGTTKVFDEKHMICYRFQDAIVQSEMEHHTFSTKQQKIPEPLLVSVCSKSLQAAAIVYGEKKVVLKRACCSSV
ncbi:hypothetical protein E2320_020005 [Naja naja]|nr:hypothetical protein E2320_020005 [Naja naja]